MDGKGGLISSPSVSSHELVDSVEIHVSLHFTILGTSCSSSHGRFLPFSYHTPCPGYLGDVALVSFVHDPTCILRQKHRSGTSRVGIFSVVFPNVMVTPMLCLMLCWSGGLGGALEHKHGPRGLTAPSCRGSFPYLTTDGVPNPSFCTRRSWEL